MYVVKFGGSLIKKAKPILEKLKEQNVLIIPGGSVFADEVRKIYKKYKLSELAAHKMAILAMDQYGLFLSDISGIPNTASLESIRTPCIFLPYKFLENAPFQPSWDITSDTIACHIAHILKAELILLKNVSGIYINGKLIKRISAEELQKYKTCVDAALPEYLMNYKMNCWIVNGNNLTKGTIILGSRR